MPTPNTAYRRPQARLGTLLTLALVLLLAGCQTAYYGALEKLGIEKRDVMVDRVESARDAQEEAGETFRSALEQFQAVIGEPNTELQTKYEEIRDAYDDSAEAAENVNDRIAKVEEVSEALFAEWEDELEEYSDPQLRQDSAQKLRDTRRRYETLITAMHNAAERMDPVLDAFQDQVLYLKHNLNAQAVQGMKGELNRLERDVDELIERMQQSIAESERFIRGLD